MYIVVNIIALVLSLVGLFATLYIHEIWIIIYTLLTIALPGTFFLYQIFELFAIKDTREGDNRRLNDSILLAVFSLPYIFDFMCGIFAIMMMSRIASFNEFMKALSDHDEESSKKLLDEVFIYY